MSDKQGRTYDVKPYDAALRGELEAMYEGFQPKRAAQSLPPSQESRLRAWLDRTLAVGHHLVVFVQNQLVGHIMLIPMKQSGSVELANFLHQSVRNRGIGTALNRVAVDLASELGYTRVW